MTSCAPLGGALQLDPNYLVGPVWAVINAAAAEIGVEVGLLEICGVNGYRHKERGRQSEYLPVHRDTDLVGQAGRVLSLTLGITPAPDYSGGELVVYDPDGRARHFRPDRDCAVVFPSEARHEARPVTRGGRRSFVARGYASGGHSWAPLWDQAGLRHPGTPLPTGWISEAERAQQARNATAWGH